MLVFEERGNWSTRRKPLSAEQRTNKLNPHVMQSLEIEPGHIDGRRMLSPLRHPREYRTNAMRIIMHRLLGHCWQFEICCVHFITCSCKQAILTLSYSWNAILSSCEQFRPMGETFIIPLRNSTNVPLKKWIRTFLLPYQLHSKWNEANLIEIKCLHFELRVVYGK